jgi:hypothetical protein
MVNQFLLWITGWVWVSTIEIEALRKSQNRNVRQKEEMD